MGRAWAASVIFLAACGVPAPSEVPPAPEVPAPSNTPLELAGADWHGFPGVGHTYPRAGLYSWNMRDESQMHYHPGDSPAIGIRMGFSSVPALEDTGGTPHQVAGYEGTMETFPEEWDGKDRQVWTGVMEGTPVRISVETVTAADREVAAAVIDSMRVAKHPYTEGFLLTFTLDRGWDAG